jgi:hypothetical protein
MLDDLSTLTEHRGTAWSMVYEDETVPFSATVFNDMVPRSPKEYRERRELGLNEMRAAAGIDTKDVFERSPEMRQLQSAAGM